MIDRAAFFPRRVRPITDAMSGLERGLASLPSLIAVSAAPAFAYAALMATLDTALALNWPAYYLASVKSQLEWWVSGVIAAPFATVTVFGLLHCLWFGTRSGAGSFSRIALPVYGLGVVWLSLEWLVVRVGVLLTEWTMYSYTDPFDYARLRIDFAAVRAFETFLHLSVAAASIALFTSAALAATKGTVARRVTIISLLAGIAGALIAAMVLKHGQFFLTDTAPQPEVEFVANSAILSMAIALGVVSAQGWFEQAAPSCFAPAGVSCFCS